MGSPTPQKLKKIITKIIYRGVIYMENKTIVNVSELSALLKVSPQQIRTLARCGNIPSLRVGGQYRFILEDVLKSLKKD